MRLFLAMQVRVMAACMESQADILECTASAQSGRREVTVCFSPMSMGRQDLSCNTKLQEKSRPRNWWVPAPPKYFNCTLQVRG